MAGLQTSHKVLTLATAVALAALLHVQERYSSPHGTTPFALMGSFHILLLALWALYGSDVLHRYAGITFGDGGTEDLSRVKSRLSVGAINVHLCRIGLAVFFPLNRWTANPNFWTIDVESPDSSAVQMCLGRTGYVLGLRPHAARGPVDARCVPLGAFLLFLSQLSFFAWKLRYHHRGVAFDATLDDLHTRCQGMFFAMIAYPVPDERLLFTQAMMGPVHVAMNRYMRYRPSSLVVRMVEQFSLVAAMVLFRMPHLSLEQRLMYVLVFALSWPGAILVSRVWGYRSSWSPPSSTAARAASAIHVGGGASIDDESDGTSSTCATRRGHSNRKGAPPSTKRPPKGMPVAALPSPPLSGHVSRQSWATAAAFASLAGLWEWFAARHGGGLHSTRRRGVSSSSGGGWWLGSHDLAASLLQLALVAAISLFPVTVDAVITKRVERAPLVLPRVRRARLHRFLAGSCLIAILSRVIVHDKVATVVHAIDPIDAIPALLPELVVLGFAVASMIQATSKHSKEGSTSSSAAAAAQMGEAGERRGGGVSSSRNSRSSGSKSKQRETRTFVPERHLYFFCLLLPAAASYAIYGDPYEIDAASVIANKAGFLTSRTAALLMMCWVWWEQGLDGSNSRRGGEGTSVLACFFELVVPPAVFLAHFFLVVRTHVSPAFQLAYALINLVAVVAMVIARLRSRQWRWGLVTSGPDVAESASRRVEAML